ncbi:MAG: hypothetical protein Q7R57_08640 [Dehalococcoidales bacterium]|nr:hypothetical protein [Dehalococcoidales bacterium]
MSFIRGLVAAVLLGASTVGYAAGKISIPSRIITFVGGVLFMVTSWQISLLSLVVVAAILVGEKLLRRPAGALQG